MFSLSSHTVARSFLLYYLILLAGCAYGGVYQAATLIRYTSEIFPPTSKVEVFSEDVERSYTIIGELKMSFSPDLSREEMIHRMKGFSQGLGADAIIGFEREVVEVAMPGALPEPTKRRARHQRLDIFSPEAKEENILLRGLAIRYR